MISKFSEINKLLKQIAEKLETPVELYIIGGAALMHYGSKEDILLFKSMTLDRPGDKEDSLRLIQQGIDWKIILTELLSQIKSSDDQVWATFVNQRFEELEDAGVSIPILPKIRALSIKYYDKLEKETKKI